MILAALMIILSLAVPAFQTKPGVQQRSRTKHQEQRLSREFRKAAIVAKAAIDEMEANKYESEYRFNRFAGDANKAMAIADSERTLKADGVAAFEADIKVFTLLFRYKNFALEMRSKWLEDQLRMNRGEESTLVSAAAPLHERFIRFGACVEDILESGKFVGTEPCKERADTNSRK